jgi:lipoprotein-anchoring transpeptidase ErfK/SrfK
MKRGIFASALAVAIALGPVPAKAVQSSGCFLLGCIFQGRVSGTTRSLVSFAEAGKYQVGSIIVRTPERALYLVLPDGKAMRYRVGVGREGFQWSGNSRIINKAEWPGWTPPAEMIKREREQNGRVIPTFMPGGPNNPLGARALYIGGTIYRIHGTNQASTIGGAVSSGCIRMMNADVIDLYERVKVGAKVYVYQ